jgi:hypothetical protein
MSDSELQEDAVTAALGIILVPSSQRNTLALFAAQCRDRFQARSPASRNIARGEAHETWDRGAAGECRGIDRSHAEKEGR